jgi:hypothetical protein
MPRKKIFYRVFDTQRGCYFATGYNATSKKELVEDFRSYIAFGNDSPNRMSGINSWNKVEDWLQGSELEKSFTEFPESDLGDF